VRRKMLVRDLPLLLSRRAQEVPQSLPIQDRYDKNHGRQQNPPRHMVERLYQQ
jgi:hypothetical protein